MVRRVAGWLLSAVMLVANAAEAADPAPKTLQPTPSDDASAGDFHPGNLAREEPHSNTLMVGAVSGAVVLGVLSVGTVAWWTDGLKSFSLRDTGFFEHDTYAGGADKAGHFYASYLTARQMVPIYEKLDVDPTSAVWYSTAFTALLFNGFELIDGFTDFGFEYSDVIANTLGIGLATLNGFFPTVDSIIGARIAYVPSQDFLDSERGVYIKLINDYTGMLFFLDLRLKGLIEAFGEDPGLFRYLVTGVAFGTDNYSPLRTDELRRRNLGVHLSLSISEILRTIGRDVSDQSLIEASDFFDYYALPFASVVLMNELESGRWFLSFGIANRFEAGL